MVEKNTNTGFLERFFRLKEHNTDVKTECSPGLRPLWQWVHQHVNPQMLADPSILWAERLCGSSGIWRLFCDLPDCVFRTFLMSVYAKIPLRRLPGMGLNAFFAIRSS
jgi:AGZA family xanthine/uracil permease-like MFS transporter